MNDVEDSILTTTAAAHLLGVATSTVQMWMESGAIASWKTPGGHRRTWLSNVQSLMQCAQSISNATSEQTAKAPLSLTLPAEFQPASKPMYPVGKNEAMQLLALAASGLVDTPPEDRFARLVRLASQATGSPIALVSLLTSTRQWFKARIGINAQETPRKWAFCSYAVLSEEPFIVEDAAIDSRFCDNALVQGDPRIRFYAGIPVRDKKGYALGTLCVIDREPRKLRGTELQALLDLAAITSEEIQHSIRTESPRVS